jgi:hypothetical protein
MGMDGQLKTEAARARLPIKLVIQQSGYGPREAKESWKSFRCPFCGHKAGSVYQKEGPEKFHCFHDPCPSLNKNLDEAGFLAQLRGVDRGEAWKQWLQEAGVWSPGERLPPSVMPGQRGRRRAMPKEKDEGERLKAEVEQEVTEGTEREGGIADSQSTNSQEAQIATEDFWKALGIVQSEQRASVSLLQRRMSIGWSSAIALIDEMERRGLIGPARGNEPREIYPEKISGALLSQGRSGEDNVSGSSNQGQDAVQSRDGVGAESEPSNAQAGEGEENPHPGPLPLEGRGKDAARQEPRPTDGQGGTEASIKEALESPARNESLTQNEDDPTPGPVSGSEAETGPGATEEKAEGERLKAEGDEAEGIADSQSANSQGEAENVVEFPKVTLGQVMGIADRQENENTKNHIPGGGRAGGAGSDGGSGGGGGGGDDDHGDGEDGGVLGALREFYGQTILTAEDEEKLMVQRGMTREDCRRYGFRSNGDHNKAVLEEMGRRYQLGNRTHLLVKAGLFRRKDGVSKPNAQFYGWGVIGKKRKAIEKEEGDPREEAVMEEGDFEWGWNHPVLIPYFNIFGELVGLRPHKGMAKGGTPHLFVARAAGARADARTEEAFIGEGEFKSCAVHKVFEGMMGCAAIPGTSMAKHSGIQEEVKYWLQLAGVRRVYVGFDNEEKGDPKLPGYKEEATKRYDTEVWARYLAGWLVKEGYEACVVRLPNESRENGKADWDGVLARRIRGAAKGRKINHKDTKSTKAGEEEGIANSQSANSRMAEMLEKVWEEIRLEIRGEWRGWMDGAVEPDDEQITLLDEQAERIIKNKLVRIQHVPELPFGGGKERAKAWKFDKLAAQWRREQFPYAATASYYAAQLRGVVGWYYRRLPSKMGDKAKAALDDWKQRALEEGYKTGKWEKHEFFRELSLGVPEGVADFRMDCRFVLIKPNGKRDRMVILSNKLEKTKLVPLDADSFTAPRDFKRWVEDQGNFTWMTGETELELLRHDVHHYSAFLHVYQTTWFGWHADSKLWIAGDCAITPEGGMILPDREGIIWWNGLGYMMGEADAEGEEFILGKPLWHPGKGLRFKDQGPSASDQLIPNGEKDGKDTKDTKDGKGGHPVQGVAEGDSPYRLVEGEDDFAAVRDLFGECCARLCETLGGEEGRLVMGSMLAYAAAPEFYSKEKNFPGLWMTGQRGSGKTTLARWIMRIYGMSIEEEGLSMMKATTVGLALVMQQYCNIPTWLDEYKTEMDSAQAKMEFVKSLYDRHASVKKTFGEQRRKVRTNAIITSEITSGDSATRQRFPHVQVSALRRQGEHKEWFQENAKFFFALAGSFCGIERSLWRGFSRLTNGGRRSRNCEGRTSGRRGCMGFVSRDTRPWRNYFGCRENNLPLRRMARHTPRATLCLNRP